MRREILRRVLTTAVSVGVRYGETPFRNSFPQHEKEDAKMEPAATTPESDIGRPSRFVILETDADMTVWRFVGTEQASGRDQAIRKRYGKRPPTCVAVSEAAWRVRRPRVESVIRGLESVKMPDRPVPPQREGEKPLADLLALEQERLTPV